MSDTGPGDPTSSGDPHSRRWPRRLEPFRRGSWAVLVLVIPAVAGAAATDMFDDDDPQDRAAKPESTTIELSSAKYRQDAPLAEAPVSARIRNDPEVKDVLGCTGAVYAVTATVDEPSAARRPLLRWTLIESGEHRQWEPEPVFDDNLRVTPLVPGRQTVNVWVPYPDETRIWAVDFEAFIDPAHVPDRVEDAVTSRREMRSFEGDVPADGMLCAPG